MEKEEKTTKKKKRNQNPRKPKEKVDRETLVFFFSSLAVDIIPQNQTKKATKKKAQAMQQEIGARDDLGAWECSGVVSF